MRPRWRKVELPWDYYPRGNRSKSGPNSEPACRGNCGGTSCYQRSPMTEYSVEIQPDFLERQAKAQPISAVAELIWNALDADATKITVDFEDDKLGGMA